MFGSRRNRPSLIGRAAQTAARTAVVVGTANAMTNASARRNAAPAPSAAPVAAPVPAEAPPVGLTEEKIALLRQLADLHGAGVLTDEEFATQKARVLA